MQKMLVWFFSRWSWPNSWRNWQRRFANTFFWRAFFADAHRGGGFFYFHPDPQGKWCNLTRIFFRWAETTKKRLVTDLPEDPATSDERAIISASPAADDLRAGALILDAVLVQHEAVGDAHQGWAKTVQGSMTLRIRIVVCVLYIDTLMLLGKPWEANPSELF